MRNKRICIFLDRLNGGGAERVLVTLANEMSKTDIVDLVVACKGGSIQDQVVNSVNLIHLDAKRTMSSLPALLRYMKSKKPSVILSGKVNANGVASIASTLCRRTPLVISEHSLVATSKRPGVKGFVEHLIIKSLYPRADQLITVSNTARAELAQTLGRPAHTIAVVPNPVIADARPSTPLPAVPHDDTDGGHVILGMGRLEAVKGFDDLLQGFARMEVNPKARLIILGEGSERAKLEDLSHKLNVAGRVSFPGFVSDPRPYLQMADVFCLSSHAESLGNVLIEAAEAGTFIVSRNCPGGPRELLTDATNCILLDDFTPQSLASALETAVEKSATLSTEIDLEPFKVGSVTNRYRDHLTSVIAAT
jgi:glycosyltransferase involved in cell wall biosynthesis